MKKLGIAAVAVLLALTLTACGTVAEPTQSSAVSTSSSVTSQTASADAESGFVGKWICSRENSCNDMQITLNITQNGNMLSFDRNMVSESGVGSSHLFGEAEIKEVACVYADYATACYVLTEEGLYEIFTRDGRVNLYLPYKAE